MSSTYLHPRAPLNRMIHYLLAGLMAIVLISVPLQMLLGVLISGAWMFFITAALTLLLVLPLILQLTATPAVTLSDDGLTVQPVIWKAHFVSWAAVTAIKPYPLLPTRDGEGLRRFLVGKKTYRPAEGIMLVIPSLPLPYRVTGFFAGEGVQSVVAFTNRTHTDYDLLAKHINRQLKKTGVI